MNRLITILAALVLAAAAIAARAADKPKQVQGTGCLARGVETGCLLLKDASSGTLYNLLFKGPRPQVSTAIHFTGVLHEGVSMCMQGTPVEVTQWDHADGIKCAQSEAPRE